MDMAFSTWVSRTSGFLEKGAYIPDGKIWDSVFGKIATILFVSNILFMTRAYALSNLVETLLFFLFLAAPNLRRELFRVIKDPVVVPLLLFFGWTLLSTLWGEGSIVERLDDWWGWRKLLLFPLGLVLLSDPRVLRAAVLVAICVGFLFFSLAVIAWLSDLGSIWGRSYTSVLQNHNSQGVYFSLLAAALLITARSDEYSASMRLLMASVGIGLLAFTIGLGSSRSGYVAAAIAITISGGYWMRGRKTGFILAVFTACSLLAVSPFASQRVEQAVSEMKMGLDDKSGHYSSGSIRVVMWLNTLEIVREHWLIGTGAGGFPSAYQAQVTEEEGWRAKGSDDPHNHYLHVWAEYGVIGIGLFLLFIALLACRCRLTNAWGTLLFVAIATSIVVGLFDGVFGSAINGRIYILAFVICISNINARRVFMPPSAGASWGSTPF
jgi:O-antigen ligase